MGVVTVKATAVSNADQLYPKILSAPYLTKGAIFCAAGTLEVGSGDSIGSLYRFARIPSGARIHNMEIFSDAIAQFSSAKVGLYTPQDQSGNAGGVVSDALFGSGIDLSVQQTEPYDVIFNNLGIENIEKRVWELLGLTADPCLFYDVTIKSVLQNGGTGTLSMRLEFAI